MKIFPAIDLYEGKAVRLLKGDYSQMTIYSEQPLAVARDFEAAGADCLHLVDLEGARLGTTPNLALVTRLAQETSLFTEIGGGIRSMETVKTYIAAGVDRVILGTAAVENETFLREAVAAYGEKIAVGVDIKDGFVAVKGWTETSASTCFVFCDKMKQIGVRTLICTDISKDGAMQGTNELVFYDITASSDGRRIFTDILKEVASQIFIPLTVGGGIQTLEDFDRVLKCGADKVSVNSGAIKNPALIRQAAERYGRQCVVLSVDIKRVDGVFRVFSRGSRDDTGMEAIDWIRRCVADGAGEVVVNSIDTDGVKNGFDLELLRAVTDAVAVPVIASGGAGCAEDFVKLFQEIPAVDAGLRLRSFISGKSISGT